MWMNVYRFSYCLNEISYSEEVASAVSSLKELCCNNLVCCRSLLRTNPSDLPRELKESLLSSAIALNQKESLTALLKIWQHGNIKLEIPNILRTWKVFLFRKNIHLFKQQISELMSCVGVIIAHYLRQPESYCCARNVEFLDFSALPAPDDFTNSVCSLIYSRLQRLSENYISYQNIDMPTEIDFADPQNFFFDSPIIKINCIISTEATAEILNFMLKRLKEIGKPQYLLITGLHVMSEAYGRQVLHLTDLLNPQFLDALTFRSCTTAFTAVQQSKSPMDLLKVMKKFTRLKLLDLSYTCLDLRSYNEQCVQMGDLLSELVSLEQLNLSGCIINGSLEFLLGKLCLKNASSDSRAKLECLAIECCILSIADLDYLAQSPHAATLKNLNLRGNEIDVEVMKKLLVACENLCVLDLETCRFVNGNVSELFPIFKIMKKLRYLDVNFTSLHPDMLLSNVKCIGEMTRLDGLKTLFSGLAFGSVGSLCKMLFNMEDTDYCSGLTRLLVRTY